MLIIRSAMIYRMQVDGAISVCDPKNQSELADNSSRSQAVELSRKIPSDGIRICLQAFGLLVEGSEKCSVLVVFPQVLRECLGRPDPPRHSNS